MSKDKSKRGFVRPQLGPTEFEKLSEAYATARAADRAATRNRIAAHAEAQGGHIFAVPTPALDDVLSAEREAHGNALAARDALVSTPAANWGEFARKLEVVCEYADEVLGLRSENTRELLKSEPHEWPTTCAALNVFLDALALNEGAPRGAVTREQEMLAELRAAEVAHRAADAMWKAHYGPEPEWPTELTRDNRGATELLMSVRDIVALFPPDRWDDLSHKLSAAIDARALWLRCDKPGTRDIDKTADRASNGYDFAWDEILKGAAATSALMPYRLRALAREIVNVPDEMDVFDPADPSHVLWAQGREKVDPVFRGFVAMGFVALYLDTLSLEGSSNVR